MTQEKENDMPEEMSELCKRTWAAIDELEACVKEEKDEDEEAEYRTRVSTVGMTMVGLGLGLSALGDLALYLVEVDKILEESEKEQDSDNAEWPDTIGEEEKWIRFRQNNT